MNASSEIVSFILQGGNLALLAVVLGGFYKLARDGMPLMRDLVGVLARVDEGLASIRAEQARMSDRFLELERRGVCPILERRDTPFFPPPTDDPKV